MGVKVVEDYGIKFGQWNVRFDVVFFMDVFIKGKCEGNFNWESVKFFVRVQINILEFVKGDNLEVDVRFCYFVREVERRCLIIQFFKRSGVQYESEWLNEVF